MAASLPHSIPQMEAPVASSQGFEVSIKNLGIRVQQIDLGQIRTLSLRQVDFIVEALTRVASRKSDRMTGLWPELRGTSCRVNYGPEDEAEAVAHLRALG